MNQHLLSFFFIWCLLHFQLAHAFYHDTSHDLGSPEVEGQCGIKAQSMDSRFRAGTGGVIVLSVHQLPCL